MTGQFNRPGTGPTSDPDRYALIGHPVLHSWSPLIHGLFAKQTGRPLQYRLLDVEASEFGHRALRFFVDGGLGLNITVPHKEAAAALADELTPRAARAGAVNTLAPLPGGRLLGDNTDGAGLLADLRYNLQLPLEASRILVLGAGGASRGVIGPLLDAKPRELVVANRNEARAEELVARFPEAAVLRASSYAALPAEAFDLVINATSASLAGEVPPLPEACLGQDTVVYDMAYGKDETPFTRHARALGVKRTWLGWGMLVEQAAEAYLLWRGVRPQTAAVLALLRAGAAAKAPAGGPLNPQA